MPHSLDAAITCSNSPPSPSFLPILNRLGGQRQIISHCRYSVGLAIFLPVRRRMTVHIALQFGTKSGKIGGFPHLFCGWFRQIGIGIAVFYRCEKHVVGLRVSFDNVTRRSSENALPENNKNKEENWVKWFHALAEQERMTINITLMDHCAVISVTAQHLSVTVFIFAVRMLRLWNTADASVSDNWRKCNVHKTATGIARTPWNRKESRSSWCCHWRRLLNTHIVWGSSVIRGAFKKFVAWHG